MVFSINGETFKAMILKVHFTLNLNFTHLVLNTMLMEALVAISSEVNILLGFHCSKSVGTISLQETPEWVCRLKECHQHSKIIHLLRFNSW